jgi:hypothetical protein
MQNIFIKRIIAHAPMTAGAQKHHKTIGWVFDEDEFLEN